MEAEPSGQDRRLHAVGDVCAHRASVMNTLFRSSTVGSERIAHAEPCFPVETPSRCEELHVDQPPVTGHCSGPRMGVL